MMLKEDWLFEAEELPDRPPEDKIAGVGDLSAVMVEGVDGRQRATVRDYAVELDPVSPVASTCSCPNFQNYRRHHGQLCKHIYALARVLANEEVRQARPSRPSRSSPVDTMARGAGSKQSVPLKADGTADRRFTAGVKKGAAWKGAGRPPLLTPKLGQALPDFPEALPKCDPLHRLGVTGSRADQRDQHRELLRLGAFSCGSVARGQAMDIREAVVRFRLLERPNWALAALKWCALREPQERQLLMELADTVGRYCSKELRRWFAELDPGEQ